MNKTALIIGVLALTGVGAYFYFKPKATSESTTDLGGLGGLDAPNSTTTPVPPAGTQLTTPEQVEEIAIKISTARDLTKIICDLKKQYKITVVEMNDFMNFTSYVRETVIPILGATTLSAQELNLRAKARKKAVLEVADSINKLKELGYKEENCQTVRIA